ncbi:MAG: glycoside hydrolase family 18 protein [Eubacterium sp.]
MNFVPYWLRLFNHKIDSTSFCGNSPVASGEFKGNDGDYLDLSFSNPTQINAITLFEKGINVTDFEIYCEKDGKFERIYRQSRIDDFHLCAIDEITTKKIRIKILKTRKGFFKNIKACVYNMPKKKTDFRTTAYVVADSYEEIDPNNLKHYNKFNIIGGIVTDEQGNVILRTKKFEETLNLIRDFDNNADIVVTLQPEGDIVKTFKNPKAPYNIKQFIDKYNLNGVSFDWEYPKNLYEWRVFDKFIVSLKKVIGEKTITLALASWYRYNFSKAALNSIDVAEIMTYDNMPRDIDGHHSEFFSDGPNAIMHFLKKGFSLSQLDLGLPYYARPVDGTGYWSDYKKEVDRLDKYTNVVENEYRDLDWKQKEITVKARFYNSCQMIEDKTAYCVYADVGGVMVWSLCSDTPEGHPLCLSKVLTKVRSSRIEQ